MKSVMFRQASTLILIGISLIAFGSAALAAEVLAISIDSGPLTAVNNWVQRKKLNYPVLHDRTYSVRASHNVKLIPTVYVLDRNLRMVAKVIGEINWNGKQAMDLFERLLSSPRSLSISSGKPMNSSY